ncbi:hypothetical protein GCM10027051_25560 [Niabella terrae]
MKNTLLLIAGISGLLFLFNSCEKDQTSVTPEDRKGQCESAIATIGQFLQLSSQPRELKAAYMYLKLADIPGESADKDHKDWIDLISVSVSNQVNIMGQPGTATQGGSLVQDFKFSKLQDKASTALKDARSSGRTIPKALLSIRKNAGSQQAYLQVELRNVQITSYQIGGSGSDESSMETASLNFEEIKVIKQ